MVLHIFLKTVREMVSSEIFPFVTILSLLYR